MCYQQVHVLLCRMLSACGRVHWQRRHRHHCIKAARKLCARQLVAAVHLHDGRKRAAVGAATRLARAQ
eukprot:365157-Chlamydomonas_euryale.AAC.20